MCGIAAIQNTTDDSISEIALERMISALGHRGPDGAGLAVMHGGRVGLAHTRLAIVDLETGAQPIFDAVNASSIVMNGEFYGHGAVRDSLREEGHLFYTNSDAEVVLHLYRKHGLDVFRYLRGEFALLIYDASQRRLIAARDPMGIKPLYWTKVGSEFLFASEVKGLFAHPRVPRALAPDHLTSTFLGICAESACAFEDIKALAPGSFMVVGQDGKSREHRYWKPPQHPMPAPISFPDAQREMRARLTKAVRERLVADVPVDVYLSSGVDSSVVLALMQEAGATPRAHHIAFSDAALDESSDARVIAQHFGVPFCPILCTTENLAELLPDTVFHTETTLGNLNSAAKFALSDAVRKAGTKACLTGEGADENFAGYPYFRLEYIRRLLDGSREARTVGNELFTSFAAQEWRSEEILWSRRRKIDKTKPLHWSNPFQERLSELDLVHRHLFALDAPPEGRHHTPSLHFDKLFAASEVGDLSPLHLTRHIAYHCMSGYILPCLGDRVEMAHGVECRTPYLERDVVELACQVPDSFLLAQSRRHGRLHLREKHLLRQTFHDDLPPSVQNGSKHPLLSPSWRGVWETKPGRSLFEEHLSLSRLRQAGLFRARTVRSLYRLWTILPRQSTLRKKLDLAMGAILTTQMLHQRLVENFSMPATLAFRPAKAFPFASDRSPQLSSEITRFEFFRPEQTV